MNEFCVMFLINDYIVMVLLNCLEKYNGFDLEMMCGLVVCVKKIKKNCDVWVVILCGEGKVFCVGFDFVIVIKMLLKMLLVFIKFGIKKINFFQQVCWVWWELLVLVIVVLYGYCYGGGLQLVLVVDFCIVMLDCELLVMESKWGLILDMIGIVILCELVFMDVVKELVMIGCCFDVVEVKILYLVMQVVEWFEQVVWVLVGVIFICFLDVVSVIKVLFYSICYVVEE